eukprot:jgi/Chrzof1/1453/Cz10g08150.t1
MEKLLELLEAKPRLKYLGKNKLKAELKGQVPGKVIDQYLAESDLRQVFKPLQKRGAAQQYKITALPRLFQVDIVNFGFRRQTRSTRSRRNDGYEYALLCVDILSRKAWLYLLKSRSMADVIDQYDEFLQDVDSDVKAVRTGRDVNMVSADDEFAAKDFVDLNRALGIAVYTDVAKDDHQTGDSDRLGIVDRLVGTLKRQLQMRYIAENNDGRWTELIGDIVHDYNNTKHSALNMTPNQAWKQPYDEQISRHSQQSDYNASVDADMPKFAVGDVVRVLQNRGTFEREGPRFSKDLWVVDERDGYRYLVRSQATGARSTRRFKANELQKVSTKAKPLVAKVVAAKKADTARKKVASRAESVEFNTSTSPRTTRQSTRGVQRPTVAKKKKTPAKKKKPAFDSFDTDDEA